MLVHAGLDDLVDGLGQRPFRLHGGHVHGVVHPVLRLVEADHRQHLEQGPQHGNAGGGVGDRGGQIESGQQQCKAGGQAGPPLDLAAAPPGPGLPALPDALPDPVLQAVGDGDALIGPAGPLEILEFVHRMFSPSIAIRSFLSPA